MVLIRRMSRRKIRPSWKTMHERPAPRKDSKVRRLSCSTKQLSMFPTLFFRNVNPEILFKQEPNSSAVELEGEKSASDDVGPPFFFLPSRWFVTAIRVLLLSCLLHKITELLIWCCNFWEEMNQILSFLSNLFSLFSLLFCLKKSVPASALPLPFPI